MTRLPARWMWIGREVTLVAALYLAYRVGRVAALGREDMAFDYARELYRFEEWLRLPSEAAVQSWIDSEQLYRLANTYYVSMHFPVTVLFVAIGLFLIPRAEYVWARRLLVTQTSLALVIHVLVPMAPPRMFPQKGFVDTMAEYGPSAYNSTTATLANQFAAMPSLHVGWAVLIAVVVARTGPRWIALLAGIHAAATGFVVVVTANHWWFDGVAAVLLLLTALVAFPGPNRNRLGSPAKPDDVRADTQVRQHARTAA